MRRLRFVRPALLQHSDYRWNILSFVSSCRRRLQPGVPRRGDLSAAAPPIRESKYLSRAMHRYLPWMLLNRRMEVALENLYKQGKVVGGFTSTRQEGVRRPRRMPWADDWLAPMIRNQGAMLVRGFSARDIMRIHAKGDSPPGTRRVLAFWRFSATQCLRANFHAGRTDCVMAGVCLGARLQGKNIAG